MDGLVLSPSTASTRLDFQVDASSAGGDFFDVVIDNPQVTISLITPSGLEIGMANASSLGYDYQVFPAMKSTALSLFAAPGTHVLIARAEGDSTS